MISLYTKIRLIIGLLVGLQAGFVLAELAFNQKVSYVFQGEPIDVVIPAVDKDLETLDLCIEGIRKYCVGVRNIYVVSQRELTAHAFWFCESLYPFSKQSVAEAIFVDPLQAKTYLAQGSNRIGWIFQQLLKLYAPFVIPGISSNVLLVDADTIFLNTTHFLNKSSEPLFNPGSEYHEPYFAHASFLIQGFKRMTSFSGISHHMLIQHSVLKHLFEVARAQHGVDFWKAFCRCISGNSLISGAIKSPCSEFEIYFNFILSTSDKAHMRELKWMNVHGFEDLQSYKDAGYHYVSAHAYLRKKKE